MAADGSWKIEQDIEPYLKAAKLERELFHANYNQNKKNHIRKFATIPDIVAIEILQKHKINIHDPSFNNDKEAKRKLRDIIIAEYPEIMSSTS